MGMMTPFGWREDLADTPENQARYGGTTTQNRPITPEEWARLSGQSPSAPTPSAPAPSDGTPSAPSPGPAPSAPSAPGPGAASSRTVASDGQSLAGQSAETQAAFQAAFGAGAAAEWVRQHEQGRPSGFNPPQNVNTPSGAPSPGAPQPGAPAPGAPPPNAPPPNAPKQNGRSIVTPTGQVVTLPAGISDEDLAQLEADMKAWAKSVEDARAFNQGIEQGKLDLARAAQAAQEAYQASYLAYLDRQAAQQAAEQALMRELERQKMELQRVLASETAALQREQMAMQRGQLRRRRAVAVRYL